MQNKGKYQSKTSGWGKKSVRCEDKTVLLSFSWMICNSMKMFLPSYKDWFKIHLLRYRIERLLLYDFLTFFCIIRILSFVVMNWARK